MKQITDDLFAVNARLNDLMIESMGRQDPEFQRDLRVFYAKLLDLHRLAANLRERVAQKHSEPKVESPRILPRKSSKPVSESNADSEGAIESANPPQFYKSGDKLLKLGVTKKGKPYRHNAPFTEVVHFVHRLLELANEDEAGKPATLLPFTDSRGSTLANSKFYTIVDWLLTVDFIEKSPVHCYRLTSTERVDQRLMALWEHVPVKG